MDDKNTKQLDNANREHQANNELLSHFKPACLSSNCTISRTLTRYPPG